MSGRSALSLGFTLLGSFLGGPVGGAVGGFLGGYIGALAFPEKVQGPRIDEFRPTTSSYGVPIPYVYGSMRLGGNIIHAGPVEERGQTTRASKTAPKVTSYFYFQTVAIGLCEGLITDVLRIWADKKLIFDKRVGVVGPQQANPFSVRVYPGDESQEQDPALAEIDGAANVPAYRGFAYIVLEDFPLNDYGNRLPIFEFEVIKDAETERGIVPIASLGTDFQSPSPHLGLGSAWHDPYAPFVYYITLRSTDFAKGGISKVSTITGEVEAFTPFYFDFSGTQGQPANNTRIVGGQTADTPIYLPYNALQFTRLIAYSRDLGFIGQSVISQTKDGFGSYSNYHDISTLGDWAVACSDLPGVADPFRGSLVIWARKLASSLSGLEGDTPFTRYAATAEAGLRAEPSAVCMVSEGTYNAAFWVGLVDGSIVRMSAQYNVTGNPLDLVVTSSFIELLGTSPSSYVVSMTFLPATDEMLVWFANGNCARVSAVDGSLISLLPFTVPSGINQSSTENSVDGFTDDRRGPKDDPWFVSIDTAQALFYLFNAETGEEQTLPYSLWGITTGGGVPAVYDVVSSGIFIGRVNYSGDKAAAILYVAKLQATAQTLQAVCEDVSAHAAMEVTEYDYSAFAAIDVRGFIMDQRMPARNALQSLQPAYFFDLVEVDWQIKGVVRGGAIQLTITDDTLGAGDDPGTRVQRLTASRAADKELPEWIDYTFFDPARDYLRGSEPSRRPTLTQYSDSAQTIQVPVVMSTDEAASASQRNLALAWALREAYQVKTGPEYLKLIPTDRVIIDRNGREFECRVTRVEIGANFLLSLELQLDDSGAYSLTATGANVSGFVSSTLEFISPPEMIVMDTALLQEQDDTPGVYASAGPLADNMVWVGAILQKSIDDVTFADVGAEITVPTFGRAQSLLQPNDRYTVWDRSSYVDIHLNAGTVSSVTEAQLIASHTLNLAFMGQELFQFATVESLGSNKYRLSTFLRGRLGTEQHCDSHAFAERFILVSPAWIQTINYAATEIDATRFYRAVTGGLYPFSPSQEIVQTTRRLMPYAPFFIRSTYNIPSAGDYTITWLRRSRVPGISLWSSPVFEQSLVFEIDILNSDNTVVRTITSTASPNGSQITNVNTPTAIYKAADIVADLLSVSPGAGLGDITIKVYQLNEVRGRGYAGTGKI